MASVWTAAVEGAVAVAANVAVEGANVEGADGAVWSAPGWSVMVGASEPRAPSLCAAVTTGASDGWAGASWGAGAAEGVATWTEVARALGAETCVADKGAGAIDGGGAGVDSDATGSALAPSLGPGLAAASSVAT
jgi:hypothetical protein